MATSFGCKLQYSHMRAVGTTGFWLRPIHGGHHLPYLLRPASPPCPWISGSANPTGRFRDFVCPRIVQRRGKRMQTQFLPASGIGSGWLPWSWSGRKVQLGCECRRTEVLGAIIFLYFFAPVWVRTRSEKRTQKSPWLMSRLPKDTLSGHRRSWVWSCTTPSGCFPLPGKQRGAFSATRTYQQRLSLSRCRGR